MAGDGVLIVEDHRLLAQAVAMALTDRGLQVRLADPTALDEAVATVEEGTLVLLDLRLGGGRDGGRAIAPFVRRGARVVVVTGTSDPIALARALEAGALTIVAKQQPFADLVDAVLAVRAGDVPAVDPRYHDVVQVARARRAEQDAARAVLARLSERETEVLDQLCDGRSAQEIAAAAGVSLTTVRAQIRAVLAKLDVRSQLQAVARAHELRRRAAGRRPRPERDPAGREDQPRPHRQF